MQPLSINEVRLPALKCCPLRSCWTRAQSKPTDSAFTAAIQQHTVIIVGTACAANDLLRAVQSVAYRYFSSDPVLPPFRCCYCCGNSRRPNSILHPQTDETAATADRRPVRYEVTQFCTLSTYGSTSRRHLMKTWTESDYGADPSRWPIALISASTSLSWRIAFPRVCFFVPWVATHAVDDAMYGRSVGWSFSVLRTALLEKKVQLARLGRSEITWSVCSSVHLYVCMFLSDEWTAALFGELVTGDGCRYYGITTTMRATLLKGPFFSLPWQKRQPDSTIGKWF